MDLWLEMKFVKLNSTSFVYNTTWALLSLVRVFNRNNPGAVNLDQYENSDNESESSSCAEGEPECFSSTLAYSE